MDAVALRKESVDRNVPRLMFFWLCGVALRKESVDRNAFLLPLVLILLRSLSARRAWIEIVCPLLMFWLFRRRSPQGERG